MGVVTPPRATTGPAPGVRLPWEVAPPAPPPPPPAARPAPWRVFAAFLLNPAGLLRTRAARLSPRAALAVPGVAFTLLFLQTGLDRADVDTAGDGRVVALTAIGAAYGTAGVAAVGVLVGVLMNAMGTRRSPETVVAAIALSYCPSLVYLVLGMGARAAFGWRTAVAFGVTGVVWAVGPMVGALRELSAGRTAVAVTAATVAGTVVLSGWALLGGV